MFEISQLLVIISLMLIALGGFVDMFGISLPVSKEHMWFDGIYALLLAIYLKN